MSSFFLYLCTTLFIFVCLLLILIVLIQKGRGGGLASAFGGGGGGQTAFGAKTGDVLTWVTSVIFGVFLLLAITLNLLADAQNRKAAAPLPVEPTTELPMSTGAPVGPANVPATALPAPEAPAASQPN